MTDWTRINARTAKDVTDEINQQLVRKQGETVPDDPAVKVETTRETLEVTEAIPDNEDQIVDLYTEESSHPYYPDEIKKVEAL